MSRAIAFMAGCATALALVGARPASAHAFLDHASPRVGAAVDQVPERVTLWFTEPLEPAFSSVKVLDASGKQVDRGDREVDPSNPAVLRVSVPRLSPGKYRVTWRVVSADAHVAQGDFTFDVKP
ncbi:MAG TPA: copper resistance CopC family protein [Usitatibacter sp.]|nr:copper resistance CopC family protein [Usitatibacter sp.]